MRVCKYGYETCRLYARRSNDVGVVARHVVRRGRGYQMNNSFRGHYLTCNLRSGKRSLALLGPASPLPRDTCRVPLARPPARIASSFRVGNSDRYRTYQCSCFPSSGEWPLALLGLIVSPSLSIYIVTLSTYKESIYVLTPRRNFMRSFV